ncbi:MAG: MFS transporter [Clostridia bacterium]|nr:MFS transporter [Clostridia bacterium]
MKSSSRKFYLALVLFGLMGQIAWVVENMYLNVFMYKMFNATAENISLMVTASAVAAALTTVFIGALSDKVGKRRLFISLGYILWGVSIFAFVLLKIETIEAIFPMTLSAAACGVSLTIVFDCLMTFFGSSANDAAFNAWLTDSCDEKSRGKAEGINAMMPLVAILAVFGGFMAFDLDKSESWTYIFSIIGIATLAVGILGFFLIEEPKLEKSDVPYLKSILYGFLPSTVRKNPALYLTLLLFAVFNISIQIFMPYLILYYEVSLGMTDYVFVMAPAIILASVVTALWGRVYDKKGFPFSSAFSLAFLLIGYLILVFTRAKLPVFIGSLFMMSGFLSGGAVFGAKIRDLTPKGKAGMLQGARIVSQVLIPGIIGPAIGSAVLKNAETVTNNDGTTSFVPNANIFIAALTVAALLSAGMILLRLFQKEKHTALKTPAAWMNTPKSHPRPQMRRDTFTLLDGAWALDRITKTGDPEPLGDITVPYPPESLLSGIGKSLKKGESFVYRKTFITPAEQGKRVFLHFGAVDCIVTVSLNGTLLGTHVGGYLPFSFEITPHLRQENTLIVTVDDDTSPLYPYGKQRKKRGGMWYTPISGIWQSVWLETTPEDPITSLRLTPTTENVLIETVGGGRHKTLTLADGTVYTYEGDSFTLTPEHPRLWSPEDPYLYHFTLSDGKDTLKSYFALRTFSSGTFNGKPCLLLNEKPIFLHGLLDQGYFPDGIFTPASEEGYTYDVSLAKSMGFNMLRKHIKLEPERFYYDCDRLGILVVQDLVNSGKYSFLRDTALPTVGIRSGISVKADPVRAEIFRESALETLSHLYNHPSVIAYTVFNEGWGQHDADRYYTLLKQCDPTRLYDTASGWFGKVESDFESEHIYFKKLALKPEGKKPLFLSEFGGYSFNVKDHVFNLSKTYGYKKFTDMAAFEEAFLSLYENEVIPLITQGLSAAVYTQLTDVEDETNGIVTYDRHTVKLTPSRVKEMSELLYSTFEAWVNTPAP